jgi:3-hydroxyisobutyrate dehydrogenase-like beta-hydroxyacid dehydrogenase
VDLSGTAQVADQMNKAVAMGNGELDHSSLVVVIEKEKK